MSLHVSRMYPRERGCIAPIMPVARHPRNRNSIIVADLGRDERPLIEWDVDRLREGLFGASTPNTSGAERGASESLPVRRADDGRASQDISRLGSIWRVVQRRFDNLRADPTSGAKDCRRLCGATA